MGINFQNIFGDVDFSLSNQSLFAKTLSEDTAIQSIITNAGTVSLSDVYASIPSLTDSSLFVVNDADGNPQFIFIFQTGGQWMITSPPSVTCPVWQAGITLYSNNNLNL